MDFPKTKKMLKRFAKAVVRAGRIRLAAVGMGRSKLIKNFSYQIGKITPGDLPKAVSFTFGSSAKYWQFVDEGVRGSGGFKGSGRARGGKSPFRFKKKNIAKGVIDRWIVKKGLKAARDKEGRFIKRKGLAFVIGRAIAQRGLTRTQFFSAPYKKNMKYYIDKILNAYGDDITDDIVSKLK